MEKLTLTQRQIQKIQASLLNIQICTTKLQTAKNTHEELMEDIADAHGLTADKIEEFDLDTGKIILKK